MSQASAPRVLATALLVVAVAACQSTQERHADHMPAHPTVPVQTSDLAPPAGTAGPRRAPEPEVAYVPAPPPDAAVETDVPQREAGGPLRLHQPAAPQTASLATVPQTGNTVRTASSAGRWDFLDWFGASNRARRASNPAADLRTARDLEIDDEALAAARANDTTRRYPVAVGEGGRLVPTFSDELPEPGRPDPLVTGSVSPQSAAARRADEAQPVPLRQPAAEPLPEFRTATVQPDVPAPREPAWGAPRRTSPSTLRFVTGQSALDERQRAELDRIAEAHATANGKIHIYGIARGVAGGRAESTERMRRLIEYTGLAARYLAARGVSSENMVLRTLEEQVASRDFGDASSPDQDRLEIFLE